MAAFLRAAASWSAVFDGSDCVVVVDWTVREAGVDTGSEAIGGEGPLGIAGREVDRV